MSPGLDALQHRQAGFGDLRQVKDEVAPHINYLIDMLDEYGANILTGAAGSASPDNVFGYDPTHQGFGAVARFLHRGNLATGLSRFGFGLLFCQQRGGALQPVCFEVLH